MMFGECDSGDGNCNCNGNSDVDRVTSAVCAAYRLARDASALETIAFARCNSSRSDGVSICDVV